MDRDKLLEKLSRIKKLQRGDLRRRNKYDNNMIDHIRADKLLLRYINDPKVKKAFDDIYKWYD
jgi:hypothetical protein